MSCAVVGGLSLIKCSFGTIPTPFVVFPDRTVRAEMMVMGNITDMIPLVNIEPFGMCSAPLNPAVIAAAGAPVPCIPAPLTPWISEAVTVLVEGSPAIDQSAFLLCSWAGVITIEEPGNITVMVP